MKKRKTSVQHHTIAPIWNQPLMFQVPEQHLSRTSIQLVVIDKDFLSENDVIGHVTIGPTAEPPLARQHWKDLLRNRSSAAMWHPLIDGPPPAELTRRVSSD